MLTLDLQFPDDRAPTILCLGAHSDDIELGALGKILLLARKHPESQILWVVFGAEGHRGDEARASAEHCTSGFANAEIILHDFRDGFFPQQVESIKNAFEVLKSRFHPDIIFTHYRDDRHQDHRAISDLTWQTFRNHLILEYEIPKYDGDLGVPNLFSPLSEEICKEKLGVIERFFESQRSKNWFTQDLFVALMRIRGMECHAKSGLAEAFYCRKIMLS